MKKEMARITAELDSNEKKDMKAMKWKKKVVVSAYSTTKARPILPRD